jgi:hypothetical protein
MTIFLKEHHILKGSTGSITLPVEPFFVVLV